MPSPKVFQLFQVKLGFTVTEANRLGNKAEALVKALSGIPNGNTTLLECQPPADPIKHAAAREFLITAGVAQSSADGTNYGGLIKCVSVLMAGKDAAEINRDKFHLDATRISSYAPSGEENNDADNNDANT